MSRLPAVLRCLALVGLLGFVLPSAAEAVPTELNHQGRLLDSDGLPIHDTLSVTFTLEDAAEGGLVVWSETLDVEFAEGYFSVTLGSEASNPLDAELLSGDPLWLGIAVDGGEPLQPLHRVVSAPYAVLADSSRSVRGGVVEASEVVVGGATVIDEGGNWVGPDPVDTSGFAASDHSHGDAGVPLGTVIDWWRPSSDVPIPEGYQVCDGMTVTDPQSPWFGVALPDLIGRVSLGVVEVDIGVAGGSASHDHEVVVGAHDHDMSHDHGTLLGTSGEGGSTLTGGSNSPSTDLDGSLSTGLADTTTTAPAGPTTTEASSSPTTGYAGSSATTGASSSTSSSTGSQTTAGPSVATTGGNSDDTSGSDAPTSSTSGTGSTGASSASSTGGGSGSTGSSSSPSTSSGGDHTHKTFRYDGPTARTWYTFNSSGNEVMMVDVASNAGLPVTTSGEDMTAPGLVETSGDYNVYTDNDGSHSHSMPHTHGTSGHSHGMPHDHSGPEHSHSNDHAHDMSGHDHSMLHLHQLSAHNHDISHDHVAPSHAHDALHEHDVDDHQHDFAHTHTSSEHQHGLEHDHDIEEHDHDAGGFTTQPHSGSVGATSSAGTSASSSEDNLPPYVGLLKLMRIR